MTKKKEEPYSGPPKKVCPICGYAFRFGAMGWQHHISPVDAHPDWHPDVVDPKERRRLFLEEYPDFLPRRGRGETYLQRANRVDKASGRKWAQMAVEVGQRVAASQPASSPSGFVGEPPLAGPSTTMSEFIESLDRRIAMLQALRDAVAAVSSDQFVPRKDDTKG